MEYIKVNNGTYVGTTTQGLTFILEAMEEHINQVDYWYNETDCFESMEQVVEHCMESEDPFWWCTVRLRVVDMETKHEEAEYLGCCSYPNGEDFIMNSGYFDDMLLKCIESVERLNRAM